MKVNFKILEISALAAMLCAVILSVNSFDKKCKSIETQVFRLHVIANSDSNIDQEIKLKVRDAILEKVHELFGNEATKQQAQKVVQKNLDFFRTVAEQVVKENGFDYEVTAETGKGKFPTKTYKSVTLPAGEYDCLRIILGEGKGKNWWCVMFPPLCISAAKKRADIADFLPSDETDLVNSDPRFEMRFWIVEKIRNLS